MASHFQVGTLVTSKRWDFSAVGRIREVFPSAKYLAGNNHPNHIYVDWDVEGLPIGEVVGWRSISFGPNQLSAHDEGYPS